MVNTCNFPVFAINGPRSFLVELHSRIVQFLFGTVSRSRWTHQHAATASRGLVNIRQTSPRPVLLHKLVKLLEYRVSGSAVSTFVSTSAGILYQYDPLTFITSPSNRTQGFQSVLTIFNHCNSSVVVHSWMRTSHAHAHPCYY